MPQWRTLAGISVVLALIALAVLFVNSRTLRTSGRGFLAVVVALAGIGVAAYLYLGDRREAEGERGVVARRPRSQRSEAPSRRGAGSRPPGRRLRDRHQRIFGQDAVQEIISNFSV